MDKLSMVYYGWHTAGIDAQIIAAKPEILISNTPAGLWRGNCDHKKFKDAGIKVFSYISGAYDTTRPAGYNGTTAPAISPAINQTLVRALAAEGVYGVFIDESNPRATTTNKALYDLAKSLNLTVIANAGMPPNASLYTVADYVMSDEHYTGRAPTAAEATNLSKTMVIGFDKAWTAQQAADYTMAAWAKGFRFSWHEQVEYGSLPIWLSQYIQLLTPTTPPPVEPPPVDHTACQAQIDTLSVALGIANASLTTAQAAFATYQTVGRQVKAEVTAAIAKL